MIRVRFTKNLKSLTEAPDLSVEGGRTARDVMERVFEAHPPLRGFVLDDQGGLRHHMVIFVNGRQVDDRERLSDAVADGDELYVMQALSGG